jgi:hypothetical protein
MFGRSVRATRYSDATFARSHFMSGKMRKPKGSASGGERKRTFSASDRPETISSILWGESGGCGGLPAGASKRG